MTSKLDYSRATNWACKVLLIYFVLFGFFDSLTFGAESFEIKIVRQQIKTFAGQSPGNDHLVSGPISINGQIIGMAYENLAKMIPPGRFNGALRYHSGHNFVQNPLEHWPMKVTSSLRLQAFQVELTFFFTAAISRRTARDAFFWARLEKTPSPELRK